MKKHIKTVYDHFDTASDRELLKQVAIMLARHDKEYRDAYIAKSLQEQIAEEAGYRGRTINSIIDGKDEMSLEQYARDVVGPVSKELAERVLSKLPRPLPTELDIEAR